MDSDTLVRALISLRPDVTRRSAEFLKELIRLESPAGKEGKVAQRVAEEMKDLGFREVTIDPLGSVVGRIGQGPFTLLYDAHMDTDEVSDPGEWDHDPLDPVERDGVIYGLGASDDKQGVATIVQAGGLLAKIGVPDDTTLLVFCAVMEESSEGAALRHFVQHSGVRPDAVVVCEASKLDLCLGHRGRTEIRLRTRGSSAHASTPHLGDNAILKMLGFIREVEELLPNILPHRETFGSGTQALTVISSPKSVNAIPSWCEAWYDRRVLPGETVESVIGPLRRLAQNYAADVEVPSYRVRSYTGLEIEAPAFFPGWLMGEDHPWVQVASKAYRSLLGREPVLRLWPFSTDGTCSAGELGIPTVGFGPSAEEFAHTPHDQVCVSELADAVVYLAGLPWMRSSLGKDIVR